MDCSQDHSTFGDISQGINRPIGYILNKFLVAKVFLLEFYQFIAKYKIMIKIVFIGLL